jgi:hypothetical protein
VAVDEAVAIGSLDPGSVSFGWCIALVAPIRPARDQAPRPQSTDSVWLRIVRSSAKKNVGLGHEATDFLPWAIRLARWSFESLVDSGAKRTKETTTRLAVQGPFAKIIREFESARVTQVIVEQQLGQQNITTTCLSHVFQALVAWTHPEWSFAFVAPQLTVPVFVSMLHLVPETFPFDRRRLGDLKVKQEKKFASGLCASFALTALGALDPACELSRAWA